MRALAALPFAAVACATLTAREPLGPIEPGAVQQTLYDVPVYTMPTAQPADDFAIALPWQSPAQVSALFCAAPADGRPGESTPCSPSDVRMALALPSDGGTERSFDEGRRALACYRTTETPAEPDLVSAVAAGALAQWAESNRDKGPRILLVKTGGNYTRERTCAPRELDCYMKPPSTLHSWATLQVHVIVDGKHAPLARLPIREEARFAFFTIYGDADFARLAYLEPTMLDDNVQRLRQLVALTAHEPERQGLALVDLATAQLLAGDDGAFADTMKRVRALPPLKSSVESPLKLLERFERARAHRFPLSLRDPCTNGPVEVKRH